MGSLRTQDGRLTLVADDGTETPLPSITITDSEVRNGRAAAMTLAFTPGEEHQGLESARALAEVMGPRFRVDVGKVRIVNDDRSIW